MSSPIRVFSSGVQQLREAPPPPSNPRPGKAVVDALGDLLGQGGSTKPVKVQPGALDTIKKGLNGIKNLLGLRSEMHLPRFQGIASESWSTRALDSLSVNPSTAAGLGLCVLGVVAVFTVSRAGGALAFAEGASLLVADVDGSEADPTYY